MSKKTKDEKEKEFEGKKDIYSLGPIYIVMCLLVPAWITGGILDLIFDKPVGAWVVSILGSILSVIAFVVIFIKRRKLISDYEFDELQSELDPLFWRILDKNNGLITAPMLLLETHIELKKLGYFLDMKCEQYLASKTLDIDSNGNVIYDFSVIYVKQLGRDSLADKIEEAVVASPKAKRKYTKKADKPIENKPIKITITKQKK
ncbi:MAG: hypothetical protein LBO69_01390 [Ignavibacteria bacterium]|jgi:hypothetical protein|nr:hypothetical protein [Ignavibacteria bacterium]